MKGIVAPEDIDSGLYPIITAFTNAEGGTIVIGIDEKCKPITLTSQMKLLKAMYPRPMK